MTIVFEGKSSRNHPVTIRYPTMNDAEAMWKYINELSKEKTFIRFQGEEVSLEDETKFVESQLKAIENKMSVMLLAFHDSALVGISGIDMLDKTEGHVGVLGISASKDYRGQGLGSLLLQHVLDEGIKNIPQLEIVTLHYFSDNAIGARLYERFGFVNYGVLPKGIKRGETYSDDILMYKRVIG